MSVYPNDLASSCCLDVFITRVHVVQSCNDYKQEDRVCPLSIEGLELSLKKITGWTIRILGQSSGGVYRSS